MCLTKIPLGEDKPVDSYSCSGKSDFADNPPATFSAICLQKKRPPASTHRSEFADLKNMPMIPRGDLKVSTLKRLMDRCDPYQFDYISIYF